jgi:hypothetical protein
MGWERREEEKVSRRDWKGSSEIREGKEKQGGREDRMGCRERREEKRSRKRNMEEGTGWDGKGERKRE